MMRLKLNLEGGEPVEIQAGRWYTDGLRAFKQIDTYVILIDSFVPRVWHVSLYTLERVENPDSVATEYVNSSILDGVYHLSQAIPAAQRTLSAGRSFDRPYRIHHTNRPSLVKIMKECVRKSLTDEQKS